MSDSTQDERREALSRLESDMRQSRAANDARGTSNLVFGTGNPAADLVLIGEAPGAQEDKARQPFVGPAGQILNDALAEASLHRHAVWITNAVKFRPTTPGEGKRLKNRPPTPDEVRLFRPWLERELAIVQPASLVCLGATAASAVLGRPVKIMSERGTWVPGPNGIKTMVTYHPAFLLRRFADRDERFAEFVADLRAAAKRA